MRVTIDNLVTSYQSIGRHKSTLLLLHGWGSSWETWSPLVAELSRRHRLIIPDLPGFGASQSPAGGWGMTEYVRWLERFLRSLEVTSLTAVLGHSFGGKLAAFSWWNQQAALPLVTNGFFLIDPSGIVSQLPFERRALRWLAQLIPHKLKRGALARFRQTIYTKVLQETDYYSATAFQEATLNQILVEDIRDFSARSDWSLHFCWGEHDLETPLWMAYKYTLLSGKSDVFVVPEAGHFPHVEKTDLVKQWLEAYGL